MSTYNYTISTDTANSAVVGSKLKDEIGASSITIAIDRVDTSGDSLSIVFKAAISTAENTTLDNIVAAHDGINVNDIEKISMIPEIPEGGKKKTDRGFIFTASAAVDANTPTSTTADYLVTEDLQIKGGVLYADNSDIHDSVSMEIVDTTYMWAGLWYPADYNGIPWSTAAPNGVSLHHYLKDFPVDPSGKTSVKNDAITTTPLNGLTIRLTYKAHGTVNPVKCNVGIVAYS